MPAWNDEAENESVAFLTYLVRAVLGGDTGRTAEVTAQDTRTYNVVGTHCEPDQ